VLLAISVLVLTIFFSACIKEDIPINADHLVSVENRNSNTVVPQRTILGDKRTNPFSLQNINTANTYLYGSGAVPKIKTHDYVRFEPQDYDELAILEDWETHQQVPFFDTPLEYEIIQQGQQYIDPNVNDTVLTYQYSSVPVGTALPAIQFTILDELYLDKSDLLLLMQSFFSTGNTDEINDYLLNGGLSQTQMTNLSNSSISNGLGIGYPPFWIVFPPEDGCDGDGFAWVLVEIENPEPGISPWGWNCVYVGPPIVYDNVNECGCQIPISPFKPAGCIEVEENGAREGVEIVLVKVRDSWFSSEIVYTDNQGCWKVNVDFSGEVGIKIKFKNENVKVRDIGVAAGTVLIVDQTAGFESHPYNDHYMFYDEDVVDITSVARRYWVAAHSLNFVNQYRMDASNDDIELPRKDLNWLNNTTELAGGSAAPMLQWNLYLLWVEYLLFVNPMTTGIQTFTIGLRPDIWLNSGLRDILDPMGNVVQVPVDFDVLQDVAMHELGHASHYEVVGEDYWDPYRTHTITNGGWGDFGDFAGIGSDPDRVALGEALAEYIENQYSVNPFPEVNWLLDNMGDPADGFVPVGLLFDLQDAGLGSMDMVNDPHNPAIFMQDNIEGFTPEMYFDALGEPNSISIRGFRDELSDLHLGNTPNNLNDYNNLVDIYDVFN